MGLLNHNFDPLHWNAAHKDYYDAEMAAARPVVVIGSDGNNWLFQADAKNRNLGTAITATARDALTGMVYGDYVTITAGNGWYWNDTAWVDSGGVGVPVVPPKSDIDPVSNTGAWKNSVYTHPEENIRYVDDAPTYDPTPGIDNTAAFIWANDELDALGGGTIKTRGLRYRIGTSTLMLKKGVSLDFTGSELYQDPADSGDLIDSQTYLVDLTIAANSNTGIVTEALPIGTRVRMEDGNPTYPGTSWYATVTKMDGLTVTFDREIAVAKTAQRLFYGSINTRIVGDHIHGKAYDAGGTTSFPIRLSLVGGFYVKTSITGGNVGAYSIRRGSAWGTVDIDCQDNSNPGTGLGSAGWLFQGVEGVKVLGKIRGVQYLGVTVDDRSVGLDPWDAEVRGNTISADVCFTGGVAGVYLHGEDNTVVNSIIDGPPKAVLISQTQQGSPPRMTKDNLVTANHFKNNAIAISIEGTADHTVIGDNVYTNVTEEVSDVFGTNTKYPAEQLGIYDWYQNLVATDTTATHFSAESIPDSADGYIEMTVNQEVLTHRWFGLADTYASTSAANMDYGFAMITDGTYQTRIFGTATAGTAVVTGDVLRLERVGADINWKLNGAIVRTEVSATTAALHAQVRMLAVGNKIDKPIMDGKPIRWDTKLVTASAIDIVRERV